MDSNPCATQACLSNIPCARFCEFVAAEDTGTNNKKRLRWDERKIKSCLSDEELADFLLMKNIAQGSIVSGSFLPLIFDECPTNAPAYLRSTPFLKQLVVDKTLMEPLDDQQRFTVMVGARDLWLAANWGLLNDETEIKLVEDLIGILGDDMAPTAELDNLLFSLVPTQNRRILRYIKNLGEHVDADFMAMAVSIFVNDEDMHAVWVNAQDLSYHNFECILPLDRALHRPESGSLRLSFKKFRRIDETMDVFVGQVTGEDTDMLLQLDKLGLYQAPSNSTTRGGKRFVFSSPTLSKTLTHAVWDSGVLDMLPPKDLPEQTKPKYWRDRKEKDELKQTKMKFDFVAVNSVFRCNRFEPGDARFKLHMDTPYYDSENKHVSKHTIIVYMTGGEGTPALSFGDTERAGKVLNIANIQPMQCVIFDQRYEHEGSAFVNSDKVFLRSELIFKETDTKHVPEIAEWFSSAVYFTSQSTFQPEYAQHAHNLYESVNRAHWGITQAEPVKAHFLHKNWNGQVHFATNGFDYYFPIKKSSEEVNTAIKTCALIAVLDYYNATRTGTTEEPQAKRQKNKKQTKKKQKKPEELKTSSPFRGLCETVSIAWPLAETNSVADWILDYLWNATNKEQKPMTKPVFKPISMQKEAKSLVEQYKPKKVRASKSTKTKESKSAEIDEDGENDDCDDKHASDNEDEDGENSEDDHCCPFHRDSFKPIRNSECMDAYDEAEDYAVGQLTSSPLVLLGKRICVDLEAILVEDSKVFINAANKTGEAYRVNFASCWNSVTAESFIGIGEKVPAPRFFLPPIPFRIIESPSGSGIHFMVDFFKNDWALPVANIDREIPIPEMDDSECCYDDPPPFWHAVNAKNSYASTTPTCHGVESDSEASD